MKIFTANQTSRLDIVSIKTKKISSVALMIRAATICANHFATILSKNELITVVCGTGNNGGDGLVVANQLHIQGFKVAVLVCGQFEKGSDDFKAVFKTQIQETNLNVIWLTRVADVQISAQVIDALFGSGLNRPVSGVFADLINKINAEAKRILSIDVPSGLPVFPDFEPKAVIRAQVTITFQLPKLTFLLPEHGHFAGDWLVVDIGLDRSYIDLTETPYSTFSESDYGAHLKPRKKFAHKGAFGHVLMIAGSKGMCGAAFLSGKAAMVSGSGRVTVYTPGFCEPIIQTLLPEATTRSDSNMNFISQKIDTSTFAAIGVGPGIGTENETQEVIRKLVVQCEENLVLDADGCNALEGTLLVDYFQETRRNNTILTPHPREFDRMFGFHRNTWDRIQTARTFCRKHACVVVLKGAHTATILANGDVCFNTSGTPAMAKGGSGDVLTGIITALVGKGIPLDVAAKIGVYLHGKAAEIAQEKSHEESVLATDIIAQLPMAFRAISV